MDLESIGWNSFFATHFVAYLENNKYEYQYEAGRVAVVHKTKCRLLTKHGQLDAALSANIRFELAELTGHSGLRRPETSTYPAVGDWVMFTYDQKDKTAMVRGILPRMNKFSRNTFDRKRKEQQADEQVIAANIDIVFLMIALNHDFNQRRIERYLATIWDSGASPVILLNKADLVSDVDEKAAQATDIAANIPVHVLSAIRNEGLDALRQYVTERKTCIFIGSSGVGKSTVINKLLGEDALKVQELSASNKKGKHTTSSRELIVLDNNGLVVDTPGLREIGLWCGDDGVNNYFNDIEELEKQCRFSNCSHNSEPGCAIEQAIEAGRLNPDRLSNYQKLQREIAHAERKAVQKKNRRARVVYRRQIKNTAKTNHLFSKREPEY